MIPLAEEKEYKKIETGVEFETGRIIDGKKEYGNMIIIPSLPNNEAKNYSLGRKYNLTGISIMAYTNNKGTMFPLPFVGKAQENNIRFSVANQSSITITTGMDRSSYSAEVKFTYTK